MAKVRLARSSQAGPALALVVAVALSPDLAWAQNGWATTDAAELTRQAQAHANQGELETAQRRYLDAIAFDPTYPPAYIGLGELHERAGDAREAERAYSMGIEHAPSSPDLLLARGRLRTKLHRFAEATEDLEAASRLRPEDIGLLRELASQYIAVSAYPAALAVVRRIELVAGLRGDAAARTEAHVRARALAVLLGDADPVTAGIAARGAVRHAIARWATSR